MPQNVATFGCAGIKKNVVLLIMANLKIVGRVLNWHRLCSMCVICFALLQLTS